MASFCSFCVFFYSCPIDPSHCVLGWRSTTVQCSACFASSGRQKAKDGNCFPSIVIGHLTLHIFQTSGHIFFVFTHSHTLVVPAVGRTSNPHVDFDIPLKCLLSQYLLSVSLKWLFFKCPSNTDHAVPE